MAEKRGRPPGVKNGEGQSLAPIKKWTPQHDMVVYLHVAMKSNEAIGEEVGLSAVRVGQILKDPTAKKMIAEFRDRIKDGVREGIEDTLLVAAEKAAKNVLETIGIEGLIIGTDFKKHQDRLSLDLLKGVGFLPGDRDGREVGGPSLSEKLSERLVAALERANEVEEKKEVLIGAVGEEAKFALVGGDGDE